MTDEQRKMIERIRTEVLDHDGHGDGYEYKRFDVIELERDYVSVITEVGLVDDEGTTASIFARTRRHIFIGVRGGLTLVNAARFAHVDGTTSKVPARRVKGDRALRVPTIY